MCVCKRAHARCCFDVDPVTTLPSVWRLLSLFFPSPSAILSFHARALLRKCTKMFVPGRISASERWVRGRVAECVVREHGGRAKCNSWKAFLRFKCGFPCFEKIFSSRWRTAALNSRSLYKEIRFWKKDEVFLFFLRSTFEILYFLVYIFITSIRDKFSNIKRYCTTPFYGYNVDPPSCF